jgi:hypothetical protein
MNVSGRHRHALLANGHPKMLYQLISVLAIPALVSIRKADGCSLCMWCLWRQESGRVAQAVQFFVSAASLKGTNADQSLKLAYK